MQTSHGKIAALIAAELTARDLPDIQPTLLPIEEPRPWGVTTNVCFNLGAQLAAPRIETEGAELGKKERKKLAAKLSGEAAAKLAGELAAQLQAKAGAPQLPLIERVEAEGGYLNFYYDQPQLTYQVAHEVLAHPGQFGAGAPTGRLIMVEYAQPNTHKAFHVGHLRNASIGQAIANLLEYQGHTVLKATYIGDVGLHVAYAMWGHQHFDDSHWEKRDPVIAGFRTVAEGREYWEGRYVFARRYTEDLKARAKASSPPMQKQAAELYEELDREVRQWLKRWEEGDLATRQEWKQSRDECLQGGEVRGRWEDGFVKIFQDLQINLDEEYWFYESDVEDLGLGQRAVNKLVEHGVARVDDSKAYRGAVMVDFAEHAEKFPPEQQKLIRKLGKLTILRSDGTSLYLTKELALAKHKFDVVKEKYDRSLDESLYVVGAEQRLYFEQVFAILRLWGFPNAENCKHIAYELVVLPGGKMSSREGNVVAYRELFREAHARALRITKEKGIVVEEEQLQVVAASIAIAAIKYAMLQVTANQQIVFDFEQALSFSGRAAPYLQYAYARAGKLVEGATGLEPSGDNEPGYELHASEIKLAQALSTFPRTCREAAQKYEPALLCAYLYSLAGAFSDFYRDCRVLDAEPPQRRFRQALSAAFRQVMQTGFKLLALPLPEEM